MIHIVANNDHDLYMTQGAVVAVVSLIQLMFAKYREIMKFRPLFFLPQLGLINPQERLWQLEFTRRLGRSKLSEILGNATLRTDKYFLALGVQKAAAESFKALRQDTRDVLQAFCDVSTRRASSPPDVIPLGY